MYDANNHRWSDQETNFMLQNILDTIQNGVAKFEQPTAKIFYKTQCSSDCLKDIEWTSFRSKMRYLKQKYLIAKRWKDQVGSELFNSDEAHIETRIKTICPYYDQLNIIFGHLQPDDPIKVHSNDYLLSDAMNRRNDVFVVTNQCDEDEEDDFIEDNVNNREELLSKLKTENSIQRRSFTTQRISPVPPISGPNNLENSETEFNKEEEKQINFRMKFDLKSSRLAFERNKLNINQKFYEDEMNWKRNQLKLEKEKLEFEKRKISEGQRLKKYEIDKQFETKKLKLEKEERLQQLELELKYKYQNVEVFDERDEFI